VILLPEQVAHRVRHGNEFAFGEEGQGGLLGLVDDNGLYAVAKKLSDGLWRPLRNLPPSK
jgi:hypothetical protein